MDFCAHYAVPERVMNSYGIGSPTWLTPATTGTVAYGSVKQREKRIRVLHVYGLKRFHLFLMICVFLAAKVASGVKHADSRSTDSHGREFHCCGFKPHHLECIVVGQQNPVSKSNISSKRFEWWFLAPPVPIQRESRKTSKLKHDWNVHRFKEDDDYFKIENLLTTCFEPVAQIGQAQPS